MQLPRKTPTSERQPHLSRTRHRTRIITAVAALHVAAVHGCHQPNLPDLVNWLTGISVLSVGASVGIQIGFQLVHSRCVVLQADPSWFQVLVLKIDTL